MHKVNVYFINHNELNSEYFGKNSQKLADICATLPSHYTTQIETVKNANRKTELLASALLLQRHLGIQKDSDFAISKEGCLSLPDGSRNFCISHARDYTILAVSEDGLTIGADIEELHNDMDEKQIRHRMLVAKKVMPPALLEQYLAASSAEEPLVFTTLWTRVEAMLKAEGKGFHLDPLEHPELFDKWNNFVCEHDSHIVSVAALEAIELVKVL